MTNHGHHGGGTHSTEGMHDAAYAEAFAEAQPNPGRQVIACSAAVG